MSGKGIWTQGTQLFVLGASGDVQEINGVTAVSFPEVTKNQIDTTTLKDKAKTKKSGLAEAGEATFTVILDTTDTGHQYLTELANSDSEEQLTFIIGLDDGFGIEPTALEGVLDLPKTRTWFTYKGELKAFNPSIGEDDVVRNEGKVEVSGKPVMTLKTTP